MLGIDRTVAARSQARRAPPSLSALSCRAYRYGQQPERERERRVSRRRQQFGARLQPALPAMPRWDGPLGRGQGWPPPRGLLSLRRARTPTLGSSAAFPERLQFDSFQTQIDINSHHRWSKLVLGGAPNFIISRGECPRMEITCPESSFLSILSSHGHHRPTDRHRPSFICLDLWGGGVRRPPNDSRPRKRPGEFWRCCRRVTETGDTRELLYLLRAKVQSSPS
ncbi:hypothetical protein QBC35DRAFT_469959 [Podospora australis]|uniref:Uncharacterized protein n=1 Tax=Podospora australis TaxID=1536484 RepID=A0AAN6X2Q9_9PEZI|nr:hypothetical protein QBC35DRAFT_469959 [Podospora australis]